MCRLGSDDLENLSDGCVLDGNCRIVAADTFAQMVAEIITWRALGKNMNMKDIEEQLKAAQRELQMRQNVYPKWVAAGRMKKEKADHEIQCMESIVNTLKVLSEQSLWREKSNGSP